MVRVGGRSKGCRACRKRRIKCDESYPQCSQCLARKTECPGACQGPVFVLANPKRLNVQISKTSLTATVVSESLGLSSGSLTEQQLLSQFIYFFATSAPQHCGSGSWMGILPSLLYSTSVPELRTSILAASIAHYALSVQRQTSLVEAFDWYSVGLQQQRRKLKQILGSSRIEPPSAELICMPMMLSFFEVLCSTSSLGYFQHLIGATTLLQIRGPEDCKHGFLHLLFKSLRIQMIHVSITLHRTSAFATEPWLKIPFSEIPKSSFDIIVDILTIITADHSSLGNIQSDFNRQQCGNSQNILQVRMWSFLSILDELWEQLNSHECHNPRAKVVTYDAENIDLNPAVRGDPFFVQYTYNSTSIAMTIAYYRMARILVLSILSHLSDSKWVYDDEIGLHSKSIISSATFFDQQNIGYDYVQMVLPLRIVREKSPCPFQRRSAMNILESWQQNTSLNGLCETTLLGLSKETVEDIALQDMPLFRSYFKDAKKTASSLPDYHPNTFINSFLAMFTGS